jgi:ribosomal protein S6
MKLYELTYLLPLDLAEDNTRSLQEKINNFITEGQGTIDRMEDISKKRLGEPIKGQNMAQMGTLNFYFAPEKLADLTKKIKSEGQIIHYLILNKKPRKPEAPRRIRKMPPVTADAEKPAQEGRSSLNTIERPKKVEIKEIEKKLAEILGE